MTTVNNEPDNKTLLDVMAMDKAVTPLDLIGMNPQDGATFEVLPPPLEGACQAVSNYVMTNVNNLLNVKTAKELSKVVWEVDTGKPRGDRAVMIHSDIKRVMDGEEWRVTTAKLYLRNCRDADHVVSTIAAVNLAIQATGRDADLLRLDKDGLIDKQTRFTAKMAKRALQLGIIATPLESDSNSYGDFESMTPTEFKVLKSKLPNAEAHHVVAMMQDGAIAATYEAIKAELEQFGTYEAERTAEEVAEAEAKAELRAQIAKDRGVIKGYVLRGPNGETILTVRLSAKGVLSTSKPAEGYELETNYR